MFIFVKYFFLYVDCLFLCGYFYWLKCYINDVNYFIYVCKNKVDLLILKKIFLFVDVRNVIISVIKYRYVIKFYKNLFCFWMMWLV